jgi:hypothetical protein
MPVSLSSTLKPILFTAGSAALRSAGLKNSTVNAPGKTRGRIVVSADDKSRTVVVSGTDPDGKSFKNVAVYDKQ